MTQDKPTGVTKPMDIQDILKQLEVNDGTFPREAVAQAIAQREAMTPELLHILAYAHQNIEDLGEADYMAHLYAMYLLAEFREPRAYPLLIQFFSTPGEITLDVTGDVVTEDLGRILASVCDGDIEPITSLIENEQANEFVRYAAVASLVALVACGEQERDDVITYYKELFRGKLVRRWSHVWDGLVSASIALHPEELIGDIRLAYQHQLIDPQSIGLDSVEAVLSRDKDAVLFELTLHDRFQRIDETIQEMEWWACFQPKDRPPRPALPDIEVPLTLPGIQVPTTLPDIQVPMALPDIQTLTKKSQRQPKDKHKRKLAKASRRKNRR